MNKQQFNHVLVWALVALVPLWVGGCGKKSDNVTPSTTSVEGTWQISGYKIDPALLPLKSGKTTNDFLVHLADNASVLGTAGADLATCLTTTKITFNAGGKLIGTPGSKCNSAGSLVDVGGANAGWALNGSKLTITDGTSTPEVYDVVLSGNTLKMSQADATSDYTGDGKVDSVVVTIELTRV